MNERHMYTVLD